MRGRRHSWQDLQNAQLFRAGGGVASPYEGSIKKSTNNHIGLLVFLVPSFFEEMLKFSRIQMGVEEERNGLVLVVRLLHW